MDQLLKTSSFTTEQSKKTAYLSTPTDDDSSNAQTIFPRKKFNGKVALENSTSSVDEEKKTDEQIFGEKVSALRLKFEKSNQSQKQQPNKWKKHQNNEPPRLLSHQLNQQQQQEHNQPPHQPPQQSNHLQQQEQNEPLHRPLHQPPEEPNHLQQQQQNQPHKSIGESKHLKPKTAAEQPTDDDSSNAQTIFPRKKFNSEVALENSTLSVDDGKKTDEQLFGGKVSALKLKFDKPNQSEQQQPNKWKKTSEQRTSAVTTTESAAKTGTTVATIKSSTTTGA
jgi:hypothetical protein